MTIKDMLLPEFDHEMGTTRRLLERVPAGSLAWKPHEKSMSLGQLATHVADVPHWGAIALQTTEFDLGTHGAGQPEAGSPAAILSIFEQNVGTMRAHLEQAAGDGDLLVRWTLKKDGQEVFSMPRLGVLRTMVMNHLIHHRGQLSVYLRQNNVPLPAIYGPTADEPQ